MKICKRCGEPKFEFQMQKIPVSYLVGCYYVVDICKKCSKEMFNVFLNSCFFINYKEENEVKLLALLNNYTQYEQKEEKEEKGGKRKTKRSSR